MVNTTLLVDEHANQWIIQLFPTGTQDGTFPTRVCMLFPRSGTKTYKYEEISVRKLNVLGFEIAEGAAGHTLAVHDISEWHDDGGDTAGARDLLTEPSVYVN
jgi:hypothetical protein